MEEFKLLQKLERVQAPPGFEQKVLAQLSLKKRGLREKRRVFGLSLAGAFASLLAIFILLNVFVLEKKAPSGVARMEGESYALFDAGDRGEERQTVRVIETLDYSTEMRSRSSEPQAIYLLEQVSEKTLREIKY